MVQTSTAPVIHELEIPTGKLVSFGMSGILVKDDHYVGYRNSLYRGVYLMAALVEQGRLRYVHLQFINAADGEEDCAVWMELNETYLAHRTLRDEILLAMQRAYAKQKS